MGVSIYTLMFKLPGGAFADDWMHTVIHVVWGAAAAYAGWITPSLAQPFTLATIAVYGTLLIMGVATEGLFLDREFRIPLDAAANVFHLGLFSLGVGFVSRAKVAGAARS